LKLNFAFEVYICVLYVYYTPPQSPFAKFMT